jgi:8-amino-7-oxononanoate synthase
LTSLQRFSEKLFERQQNLTLRALQISKNGIDFYSNDYLGLARNLKLAENIKENYEKHAFLGNFIRNGATGSRLLSGNNVMVENLEKKLAKLFLAESALLFNSGYAANSALLSTVTQKGDTVIYDSLIHASLHEGCRLTFANTWAFRHNDLVELEKKLQLAKGDKFVVIESVYSMDGDVALLPEIVALCKYYKAYLIVDEAHSTGIYGENGNGLCCELGIENDIFARVYTFGKAVGVHGACVVGSQILVDYLVNFAKGFIYTTALPPHNLVSISTAFDFIAENPQFKMALFSNIQYFNSLQEENHKENFNTSIKVIKIAGNEACKKVATHLINLGFELRPIVAPTVAVGEERIRICLHAYNTHEEIANLIAEMHKISVGYNI